MRRLPPQQIEKNLSDLIDLVPQLCEDLLSSVDQPLKIAKDKENGKDYLLCDYNRDGDSYRCVEITCLLLFTFMFDLFYAEIKSYIIKIYLLYQTYL